MKIDISYSNLVFVFFLLIIVIIATNFFTSCSSSETPEYTNEGPSEIMGTFFEVPIEYTAGENPVDITIGDFNLDNRTEIIVTSPRKQYGGSTVEDGTMILFQNDFSITNSFYYTSSTIEPTSAEWRQDVIAADFNLDNTTDLIVTHTDQQSIKFLRNDGSATFYDNGSVSVGEVPLNLVSGDWNNDNQTDIAVVNRDNSSVSILQNGSGIFNITQTLVVETPISLTKGDWNNDTYVDIAVLSRGASLVHVYINDGSGKFNAQDTKYSTGELPFDLIAGDWNCDSKQDLAVTNSGDSTLSLFYGDGTGLFESQIIINSGRNPRKIAAADFDNDSKMDFVIGHHFLFSTSGIPLLTGDFSLTLSGSSNSSGYAEPISFAVTLAKEGASPAEVIIYDLDNDTKLDILFTLPARKKLVFFSGKQFFGNLSCP